jgi:ribosomal protein S18 acetylase RimI-like enzyme
MFESMGFSDTNLLDENYQMNEKYFLIAIPTEIFRGWVTESETGIIVGTIGLVIDIHPPAPNNPSGKIGYIMNLAVDKEHRRKGIARALMKKVIDFLKINNIVSAELHATDMGQELYEELGFIDSNAMRITL